MFHPGRPVFKNFVSPAVETYIQDIKGKFKNQDLAKVFENCFPNTLDTTVEYDKQNNDTFVITGDIQAMWLRDSSFQVFPYLEFAKDDPDLRSMMLGLIKRHTKSILIDPYANAFNKDEAQSPWLYDTTYKIVDGKRVGAMNQKLWERKYELDSSLSTLFFAYNFNQNTGDFSFLEDPEWFEALDKIILLVRNEMRSTEQEDLAGGPEYFFQRKTEEAFDSLHQGRGNPVNSCGLVKTMFRNSDDATVFSYNIPENALLVVTFENISIMLKNYLSLKNKTNVKVKGLLKNSEAFYLNIKKVIDDLTKISKGVRSSIYENGIFEDSKTGEKYFAYEVDCYGNHYFMDDPGYPSLISLSFFGFVDSSDPLYINTRKRVLSNRNPYYYTGSFGDGLGSSHTNRNFVWPLFTIMRILTSNDEQEIINSIDLLLKSANSTGYIHESFNINDVSQFTRSWFAWANSFFGYMINHVIKTRPHLILNP